MGPLLFRVALLTAGLGLAEIGLGEAASRGSVAGWALLLLVGLPLILGGTVGLIGPFLATGRRQRK